jgi:hypothetical protein
MRFALALALISCGRIGFNPIGGSGGDDDDSGGDAHRDGPVVGPKDAPIDATTACTNAIAIMQNVRKPSSTCAGGDRVDSCGPAGTQEVVFKFSPATTAGYNFRAFDPGSQNVSNSTQQLDPNTCVPMGGCAGILGITVAAGATAYFVVEASAGGCTNIEFEAQ